MTLDPAAVPSPSYVIDLGRLEENLKRLADVGDRTGARILLALKGFATFSTFRLCHQYLHGATASSLDEARLAKEELGGEIHGYAPAYAASEFSAWLGLVDHLSFNSVTQWARFGPQAREEEGVSCGLRINPRHSEASHAIYDPCARYSRLGITAGHLATSDLEGIDGLHFHTCCGQEADVLERTLAVVERDFARHLPRVKWVNFGGGQRITAPGYDVDLLCRLIQGFRERWKVDVYLEPGEAVAFDAGVLVTTVLDVVENEKKTAILDCSAAAHLPDVLEMPYRPVVDGAGQPGEKGHDYFLGGLSCLAGDVIGEYSFDSALRVGDRLVLRDMAHYTMVKNTTFNGVRLPSIVLHDPRTGETREVRRFGYESYRSRLS